MTDSFEDWVSDEVVMPMKDSAFVATLWNGDIDVKLAVEIGAAVLLDKPIVMLVKPGTKVSKHLATIAVAILEADMSTEEGRASIAKRLADAVQEAVK